MARLAREAFPVFGSELAPNFNIIISGRDTGEATELFDAVRPLIASVTFEDDEEMSSMFELKVINQPDTGPGLPVDWRAVTDSKAFAEGNSVDLYLGYGSELEFVDRIEITKWLPIFPEEGPGSFTIKGFDGRHAMMKQNAPKKSTKKRKTYHKNSPDEHIVKKIAEKYGYATDADPTEVKKKAVKGKGGKVQHVFRTRVQTADTSDWAFLQKLADMNRFDLWVDWSPKKGQWVVNFKKREDAGDAGYLFTYNGEDGSLISAEPDFSISDQPTDVEVLYYDRKKRTVERTIITESKPGESVKLSGSRVGPGQLQAKKTLSQGARVRFTAFGQTIEAFTNRPFKSAKEATNFVQNWLKEREREFCIVQGKVVGIPSLRSRQIHQLAGLGARLDGFYRFTNVRHMQQPGSIYACEFTAHKVLSEEVAQRPVRTTKAKATKKAS